jgi:hypothetical protein
MNYLIKDEELQIQYIKGKGAWTYHLRIPNTQNIKARWGFLKVSGTIDQYPIESKNLMPIKGSDKLLSLNASIRKSINKNAGDTVVVTLFIDDSHQSLSDSQIVECFEDAGTLTAFNYLAAKEKNEILQDIRSELTEDLQIQKIISFIEKLKRYPR